MHKLREIALQRVSDVVNGRVGPDLCKSRRVMARTTRLSSVPVEIVAVAPLAGFNYSDAFESSIAEERGASAEAWARTVLEDAPTPIPSLLRAGWRCGLGLRLGPRRSRQHVLGWEIRERSSNLLVVGQLSWLLTAQIVFQLSGPRLVWVTFVRYDRAIARAIWPPVSVIHRPITRYLLGRAARNWASSLAD